MKIFKLFYVLLFFALENVLAGQSTPHSWAFQGKYLVSVSDADMVASAYVDGVLGPREGEDKLSIIKLGGLPTEYQVVEVDASNSVAGPPAALAVSPKGRYSYVIETFTPRPKTGQDHTFNDLKLGSLLTIYDLKDPGNPKLLAKHVIGKRPDSINVSADGQWLAITYYPSNAAQSEKPLGIYRLKKGRIASEFFPAIPNWGENERLIYAEWHPTKQNTLALVNNTAAEVSFFHVNTDKRELLPWGNTVSVGKSPFIGRFTEDGNHFVVNNLYWGTDVQGQWNEAPPGTIANIQLNANKNKHSPRHALSSQVMVGPSPEGFAVSPKGDWIVTLNMERSWLPYEDPRQNWYSSLSLIQRNPESGAMNIMHTTAYDGILPEAAVFDLSGKHIAVTTFDFYDTEQPGGGIDYFRIAEDPLNPTQKKLVKLRWYTPVTRGAHSIALIK